MSRLRRFFVFDSCEAIGDYLIPYPLPLREGAVRQELLPKSLPFFCRNVAESIAGGGDAGNIADLWLVAILLVCRNYCRNVAGDIAGGRWEVEAATGGQRLAADCPPIGCSSRESKFGGGGGRCGEAMSGRCCRNYCRYCRRYCRKRDYREYSGVTPGERYCRYCRRSGGVMRRGGWLVSGDHGVWRRDSAAHM